ncbi:hypothetical protein VQ03_25290 [Methylobacterium tarhaniae]|uniref:Uncharacterized protein n=1 Tax=Methylobacterium tarhaniae TaxID=1187852 RepID=A0A0J6SHU1_9HYPH|nr:hypothetical protein VQ03_25290 [Methylobacterium tarhaniae]
MSRVARVTSSFCSPTVAPDTPTFDRPVRKIAYPAMKVERPAVQLCLAQQSVKSMPSRSMSGVRYSTGSKVEVLMLN